MFKCQHERVRIKKPDIIRLFFNRYTERSEVSPAKQTADAANKQNYFATLIFSVLVRRRS